MADTGTVLGVLAFAAAAGALYLASQARAQALPEVARVVAATLETSAGLASLRAEWVAWERQLDAALEAISDQADVIERKRRRVTSERTRIEAAAAPEETIESIFAKARAQGLPV